MVMTGDARAVAGLVPYLRSKEAAAAFEDANPVLPVAQPLLPFAPPPPLPADGGASEPGRAGAR
jgi:hypothetical protein